MSFAPNFTELRARARADLRVGLPVVIDGPTPILAAAVETLDDIRLADIRGLGDPFVAITDWRARTLKARIYDGTLARVAVPGDAGLSWIQALADPSDDLAHPMKGPLSSIRDSDSKSAKTAIQLCKDARVLPAALCVEINNPKGFAVTHGLTLIAAGEPAPDAPLLERVIGARLPMEVSEAGRLHIFRPEDGSEEHYAIEIGQPDRKEPVLSRLHSACFTGDVMGSLKCDCGPQLRAALRTMGDEGAGVLLYLNQEGRGIGLSNKMRAYSLQDQGFDTVDANHRLGFEDDERDFRLGAQILSQLGFSKVRLLTNNPAKIARMESCGLEVTERVPLKVGQTRQNAHYLATKASKSGHLL